jgi:hypothetical protein
MGAIDAQDRFENRPLVKGIGDHEVGMGMGYHVDGFGEELPVRTGYKLLGCRYTTMNGQIVYIPLKLLKKGFDIISGDLNIQLIWEPNVNDVKVQFFDGEVKQALEGNLKVVQGHGTRIKGLAPGILAAFANWIRRVGTGIAARQSGVKTHKISWVKLPQGLDFPDNYQTDGLNEDFISNIEDQAILKQPPIRTGRVMLVDGRVVTVVCEVENANTGEPLRNFQFGRTPVEGNLRIKYRIIEEEKYSLHFEANGGTLGSQSTVNYIRKENMASVRASDIPTRDGYVFKGYKAIKCTHQTVLGVSLGDDRYETKDISPAEVRSGFTIENVFGDLVFVAQWEKEQTLVTIEQQPVSKGTISQALTVAKVVVKAGWGKLSARQKITFVLAVIILLAAGAMSFLLTHGIIAISFSFFISIGLYIIISIASLIIVRLIYVIIKGFLWDMLKALGNFLTKSFKVIVLVGGKTFRRSYRVTRQVCRAPINYAKNFYENMSNIADNLPAIQTREGYEFGGFSVTNDTTGETAEFSLQEIRRDFIVPGKYFSQNEAGESIVKLKYIWLPKITITTGERENTSGKREFPEVSSREINLADYKDSLIPPEGYDYTSLYWTCDAYPGQTFAATAIVNVDKPCAFTPRWKALPKATVSVGKGTWKSANGEDATRQRPITVTATRQGAMVNLRELRELIDALEAPDDCDPDSLYFTEAGKDEPIEENEAGEVLMKSDILYTANWKTLTESNKVKLKIGEGQSIILTADESGFIDLDAVIRDRGLTPPQDFTKNAYWIANGDTANKLNGRVNIRSTSVLTLHWEAFDRETPNYSKAEESILGQEGAEEVAQLDFFPKYSIEFHSGVEPNDIDDVSFNLPPEVQAFLKNTKVPRGEKFSSSLFKEKQPKRNGYRFKGVRLEVGNYSQIFLANEKINVPGECITDSITITLLWEKEYPVTSDNAQLSLNLGKYNVKAYENNDFRFPGFGGFTGYSTPTKPGSKFRGVRVKVGDREEQHLGTAGFKISKEHITDSIEITVLWDDPVEVSITSDNVQLHNTLKVYENNDFHFPGFGSSHPRKDGHRLRIKVKVGEYEKTFEDHTFSIDGKYITGPITITLLWEKEYPVTFKNDTEATGVPYHKAAYENNDFHFPGFGRDIPTKPGSRLKGVRVQVGTFDQTFGTEPFTIPKQYITEPITITGEWEEHSPITFNKDNSEEISEVPEGEFYYEGDTFHFKGFNTKRYHTTGYTLPTRPGHKFLGVSVKNGDEDTKKYLGDTANAGFDIKVQGPISITYLWEKHSTVTIDTKGGGVAPDVVPADKFYYKGDTVRFKGFGTGWGLQPGYPIPTRPGHKFLGVSIKNGNAEPEDHLGNAAFDIKVQGPISITYLWEDPSPITIDFGNGEKQVLEDELYKGDTYKFPGVGKGYLSNGLRLPERPGHKFLGVSIKNGNAELEDHLGNAAFNIKVQGPISITYLWEEVETKTGWGWGSLFKSAESARGAAQAAAEIGVLLGTQAAGSMFVVNGSLKLIKSTMDSFAAFERAQSEQIREAQILVYQDQYFKGEPDEEILKQLLNNSGLSPEEVSLFLRLISTVELEESGEVMSYEPNTQDPSKPGKMHINYKMLRAMFLDANGNTKNIELFKVFVKHELTHMEFAISDNPLYKAAHNIPFLEEFLVSFSDLYVWQQAQLILPGYTDVIKFIFTNARILSIAAGISIEEVEEVILKLQTGMSQREMAISLFTATQAKLSSGTNTQASVLKPLSLFVANNSNGQDRNLTSALTYAETFGNAESNYVAAVIEHIPTDLLVPIGYSHRMSVNVLFNDLVYEAYVRQNDEGTTFIGLKLKSKTGLEQNADVSAQNFATAAQFFANDLNTNTVLREELNRATDIGISAEGVAMMDFIGFPPGVTIQESVQKLYQPSDIISGLVGVYSRQDLLVTPERLTTIQQDIKATKLFKLGVPKKFYEVDARLSNLDSLKRSVKIKKKEGASTIMLNITDFDIDTLLSSKSAKEPLVNAISIIHSMSLLCTIELDITKTTEEEIRQSLELGFDGISINAQNQDTKHISSIRKTMDKLNEVSKESSVSKEHTIRLKNKAVRDLLRDLSSYSNILIITNIDQETRQASIDEQQALAEIQVGYEIGRRVLEQNVGVEAENIRVLLNIFNRNHSSITVNEIKQTVTDAGLGPVLQKHIETLLNGLENDVTGTNPKVAQAIGFVRGLMESYTISMYLDTFDISFEAFSESNLNDRRALGVLLAALFIIDANNIFFKDNTTLTMFFEQARIVFSESSTDNTLSSLKKQMILFSNSIIERFETEEDIVDLALNQGNPSQALYTSLVIINDLINKVSFRKIVEQTGKRAKASASAVKNILGAA